MFMPIRDRRDIPPPGDRDTAESRICGDPVGGRRFRRVGLAKGLAVCRHLGRPAPINMDRDPVVKTCSPEEGGGRRGDDRARRISGELEPRMRRCPASLNIWDADRSIKG